MQTSTKKPKTLKKTMQRKKSKDTTNSSPVDPCYDPITKKLHAIGDVHSFPLPGPDKPQLLLGLASDDSSQDDPTSPVIQRASSVRVAKPHIVQHSNSSNGSVPKLYSPQTTPGDEGSARSKATQMLSPQFKNFFESPVSIETEEKAHLSGGPAEALKALEGNEAEIELPASIRQVLAGSSPTPRDSTKETILDWPDTPRRIEALDTLPTPMGGFGSLRIPRSDTTHSSSTYVSPPSVDGLRSNPVTETDKKLSRAISAPVRNSSRRVVIRPADLVINKGAHDHKLYRENIVSTPYPARHNSVNEIDELEEAPQLRRARPLSRHTEKDESEVLASHPSSRDINEKSGSMNDEQDPVPEIPLSTKPLATAVPVTSKSDRFPSPVSPEVLFLEIRLAQHPGARVTVEIEVSDKSTFDDEQLFTIIRDAYSRKLLGVGRRVFSARTLSHATLGTRIPVGEAATYPSLRPYTCQGHQSAASSSGLDGGDFIRHIQRPRLGRRRKMWLLWLRNNQHQESSAPLLSPLRTLGRRARMLPTTMAVAAPASAPESPVFSFIQHSRHNSHLTADASSSPILPSGAVAGVLEAPGASAMPSPSVTIPRMPFQPFPRTKSLAASPRSRHWRHAHHHSMTTTQSGTPTIDLHHTFSLPKILASLFLTFFLAAFTAVMWILFGLPGRGADQGNGVTTVMGTEYPLSWGRDAQSRVGVGLVLGIVVLLLGLVTEGVWVWGSWVLI